MVVGTKLGYSIRVLPLGDASGDTNKTAKGGDAAILAITLWRIWHAKAPV